MQKTTFYSTIPGDIVKVYANTSFTNKELGWKAEKILEDMVGSTWEWEKALSVR